MQSSPSGSHSNLPSIVPRNMEVPLETIFYEASGPAPESMGPYMQTGDLTEASGHSRPLLPCRLLQRPESRRQEEKVRQAKRYAREQSVKFAMMKQQEKHQKLQMQNLKRAQSLLLLSRVYVGCISPDVNEEKLREQFGAFGPVKGCKVGFDNVAKKHKGYAFVEYELPEPAGLCIEVMNNVVLSGRNLKVGRPSNIPNAGELIDELVREYNLHKRIYVANVHPKLSEDELRSVFGAFGTLVSCQLESDPLNPDRHRGYGFLEYSTHQSAIDSITNMNGFDLGGQRLRVCPSCTPPNVTVGTLPSVLPTAAAEAAANITAKLLAHEAGQAMRSSPDCSPGRSRNSSGERRTGFGSAANAPVPPPTVMVPDLPPQQQEEPLHENQQIDDTDMDNENDYIRGKEARRLMMHKLMRQSSVLMLANMVVPEEVDDSLEAEVTEECSRFGLVKKVLIYQQPTAVRIFIEFSQPEEAEAARHALGGRFFAGREVRADIYDEALWRAGDYQS